MSLDLLHRLARVQLPCQVFAPDEIDKLSVLRAAELIAAFIPPPQARPNGERVDKPATVLAITARGRQALAEPDDAGL